MYRDCDEQKALKRHAWIATSIAAGFSLAVAATPGVAGVLAAPTTL
jgi:hypothetical protein